MFIDVDAWHIISSTDPLVDSDEEMGDHHARLDYGEQNASFYEIPSLTQLSQHVDSTLSSACEASHPLPNPYLFPPMPWILITGSGNIYCGTSS